MWPFSKNAELSETRKRVLCMMDEQTEKDRQLSEIQPYIDPIIERALITHRNYLEISNEIGDFKVSKTEMDYIRQLAKLTFNRVGESVMFLGMNVVIG